MDRTVRDETMKFKATTRLFQTCVLAGGLTLLASCDSNEVATQVEPKLRPVRTLEVKPAENSLYKEFTAVVDASQKVDLAFKVSGRIIEMPINSGDEVREGQLVARLDDTDIKIQLDEAQSSYDKALSDFERAKDLIKTNSISQADFDQLKAQFSSAKAQLENAQNRLEYTHLYASFDGIIAERYVENFQETNAQTPIVALHDLNNINFKVDVPESILINVAPNAIPPKVTAYFESIPDRTFDLTYKEISTQADAVTKTYQVVFTMPSPKSYTLLPGMSARVRVERSAELGASANFYLPAHAVLMDAEGNYVYTVSRSGEGQGTIKRQAVSIGEITSWGIEIYSGIDVGQHVVTAGMSKVTDGMLVKFSGWGVGCEYHKTSSWKQSHHIYAHGGYFAIWHNGV